MEFAPIVVLLNTLLHKKPKETISTVRNKYSHAIFHKVTSIPLMDINSLFEKFPDVTEKFTTTQLTYHTVVATCSSTTSAVEGNSQASLKYQQSVGDLAKLAPKSLPLPLIR
jgi:hypothetical protein